MKNDMDYYMSSLSSDVREKQDFCDTVESLMYEAWGGCPETLYRLADYLSSDHIYSEMAECFYNESAKLGYAPAMFYQAHWALIYASNHSESAAAIRLLKKAAKAGSSDAYNLLGDVFKAGKGVKKNAKRAKKYYALAANNNSATNVAA